MIYVTIHKYYMYYPSEPITPSQVRNEVPCVFLQCKIFLTDIILCEWWQNSIFRELRYCELRDSLKRKTKKSCSWVDFWKLYPSENIVQTYGHPINSRMQNIKTIKFYSISIGNFCKRPFNFIRKEKMHFKTILSKFFL